MNIKRTSISILSIGILTASFFLTGCGNTNYLDSNEKILHAGVVPEGEGEIETCEGDDCAGDEIEFNSIFDGELGVPISRSYMGAIDADPTGLDACTDYDGDGIPNSEEIISNPYVADYPRIVTRISAPITMEIRVSETQLEKNHSETLTENNLRETLQNSMEDRHYTSGQLKTTPYVTKESLSEEGKNAQSYGYANATSSKDAFNFGTKVATKVFSLAFNYGQDKERSKSNSENSSIENQFARSTMSETTEFGDIQYVDNVDKNGVEFTSDTIQDMVQNYRNSTALENTTEIGPNDGYVRASLYIKNMTINMPVHITNLKCTLTFRTPSGKHLPVETFYLENKDFSRFEESVYGGEELGPFVIEVKNLNTNEVKKALANGYVPQISVVSYELDRVDDSNYNPGVDNLKIVEETAKSRTATIKIIGSGMRELHRVAAFDVEKLSDDDDPYASFNVERQISPGISLKKALFNILRDQIGGGERWEIDAEGNDLTIADSDLRWKPVAPDNEYYTYGENHTGNKWRRLETYVKSYVDDKNQLRRMETIKTIDGLSKYNPFSKEDNENYNSNELLSIDEVRKMKFWVIFHDGRYFEGDINDPIWAGERYEIVCMDMLDFNEHFENYVYTPFQSGERVYLGTRWNALTDNLDEPDNFGRAVYMGKVFSRDVIRLEIDLMESRFLFDPDELTNAFGDPEGNNYSAFNYTFEEETQAQGIPDDFTYSVYGGTNNLWVSINEAENAVRYEITFYPYGTPADNILTVQQTVKVSADDVAEKNGTVVICSQTPLAYNSEGKPETYVQLDGSTSGVEYLVTVKAIGLYPLDGERTMEVTTKGTSSSNIAYVYQPADGDDTLGAFGFSATGRTDSIDVRITASEDTEYYIVRYTGPHNYVDDPETKDVVAYTGYNSITPDRPSFLELDAKDFTPGLYSVQVFARNRYTTGDGQEATTETVYTEVLYDRYAKQRRFAPKISSKLFKLDAVDLEVNFNDGSGWFQLQPYDPYETGVFQGDDNSRIDCYYNSYMEYNEQKFIISFMAPDEKAVGLPNVFAGGRTQADLYIRTIPKKKYRDTFWMSPGLENSYLSLSSSGDDEITDYWLGCLDNGTDATNIEESVATLNSNQGSTPYSSTGEPDHFFFSPREERLYAIRGTVSDDAADTLQMPARPDSPSFEAVTMGTDRIALNNIAGYKLSSYELYYCNNSIYDETEDNIETIINNINTAAAGDATGADWLGYVDEWQHVTLELDDIEEGSYAIDGLDVDSTYTFLLAARNKYGLSIPTRKTGKTKELLPGTPEIGATGAEDDDANINKYSDSFRIVNISAENVYPGNENHYFIVYWKDAGEPDDDITNTAVWTREDDLTGSTLTIELGEDRWTMEGFTVRIYSNNDSGTSIDCKIVTILPPTEFKETAAQNVNYGYGEFYTGNDPIFDIGGNDINTAYTLSISDVLLSLFDTDTSGSLANGTCMRIVANGMNVVSESGLSLKPDCRSVNQNMLPPDRETVYIDPLLGRFLLPRPIYFSKCDSVDNIVLSPNITINNDVGLYYYNDAPYVTESGKFDNAVENYFGESTGTTYYDVFASDTDCRFPQYTISLWVKITANERSGSFWLVFYDNFAGIISAPLALNFFCNGSTVNITLWHNNIVEFITEVAAVSDDFYHLYILVDEEVSLDLKTKSLMVFINGSEGASSNIPFNISAVPLLFGVQGTQNYVTLDNIKIWNHIVSENPSWEYRSGYGRENALHEIYGSDNDYYPDLTSDGNGVGYYLLRP